MVLYYVVLNKVFVLLFALVKKVKEFHCLMHNIVNPFSCNMCYDVDVF